MYIAMNRFRVVPGHEDAFEAVWRGREGRLAELPGYIEFHMLKGKPAEDHSLYISHTVWETYQNFLDWTQSDQFRAAHARAGQNSENPVKYLSGPQFEGFDVIIHEDSTGARRAVAA